MKKPDFRGARMAPNATVVGDVTLAPDVSVWYGAVIRGDAGPIVIGEGTNVQDLCVIHEETTVGSRCTLGHSAIVHGCTIGNSCLIGMGAIVLNGAVLGDNCVVGAGAVVTGKMNAPAGSVLLGSPARIVKQVSPEMQAATETDADIYIERAKRDLPAAEDIS